MKRADQSWMEYWADYYAGCTDERSRVNLLLMLKERRDKYFDPEAGAALQTLGARWIAERCL